MISVTFKIYTSKDNFSKTWMEKIYNNNRNKNKKKLIKPMYKYLSLRIQPLIQKKLNNQKKYLQILIIVLKGLNLIKKKSRNTKIRIINLIIQNMTIMILILKKMKQKPILQSKLNQINKGMFYMDMAFELLGCFLLENLK